MTLRDSALTYQLPINLIVAVFLLTFAFVSPAQSKTLEENSAKFVEAVASGDTWQALGAFSDMSENVLEAYSKVKPTTDVVKRFVDPIEKGLAAFSGDASQLKEFQNMLDKDIASFKDGYEFEAVEVRDYGLDTGALEAMSDEALIDEYARVSTQATADIAVYNDEITKLSEHKSKLEQLVSASRLAEDKATEVAVLLEDLNAKGVSVLARTDMIWAEFVLYIQPRLTQRTTEIERAMDRIDARLENLKDVRKRANSLREWVDFFWWYETFRQSAVNSSTAASAVPGVSALDTASTVGANAGSDATSIISKLLSDTQAAGRVTDDVVRQLAAEGARKDSDAARSQRIQQLLGVASTILSEGGTIADSVSANSAGATKSSAPRIEFAPGEVQNITPPRANPPKPKPTNIPQKLPDELPKDPGPVELFRG